MEINAKNPNKKVTEHPVTGKIKAEEINLFDMVQKRC